MRFLPLVIFLLGPPLLFGDDITSVYSDLTGAGCKVIRHEQKGDPPWSERLCPGVAGYAAQVGDDDNRESLSIVYGGKTMELDLSSVTSGFRHCGKKMEWRLAGRGPFAVIFRVTDEGQAGLVKAHDYLAVAKVSPTESCLLQTIDGAKGAANELARKAADGIRNRSCGETAK